MSRPSKQKDQPTQNNFPDAQDILKNAPIGIFTSTPQGRYLSANPGMAGMLGYDSPEELLKSITDIATQVFVNPEDRLEFMRLMQEQGEVVDHECRFRRKDGTDFWVSINAHAVLDENGRVEVNQVFIRDIAKRKRAEEELADQKSRYQGIWEESPVSIWEEDWSVVIKILQRLQNQGVHDHSVYFDEHPEVVEEALRAVKILDINEETVRMFHGKDKDDFMHSLETVFATPDTLPGFIGELVALAEGRSTYRTEMRLRGLNKELIHVLLTMSFFPKHAKPGTVLVSLIDITDKQQAENAIKLERERFFLLLEIFPGFIYLQSPDYSVRYANKYFMEQFGNPKGRLCYEVLWGRTGPCEICPTFKVFDTKKPQIWEWVQAPDGKSYAIYDYPFTDSDGTELVLEIGVDITERKKAEENIRCINQRLETANAEKDMLFTIIAHDLKSPMCGLLSSTELLANKPEIFSEKDFRLLSTELYKNTKNTYELLEDLLQWARLSQTGVDFAPTVSNLNDLVNMGLSSTQNMAKSKEINILQDIPPRLTVLADQLMLKTVIRNILFNAIKFTPRRGEAVITARQVEQKVTVAVQDNGIGMNEKILSTIFTMGKEKRQLGTEGEKGTGLGLMLCKQLIDLHGGQIWVESEPGKGTKVFFTLPGVA